MLKIRTSLVEDEDRGAPKPVESKVISRNALQNCEVREVDVNGITYKTFTFQSTRVIYVPSSCKFEPPENGVLTKNTLSALHLYKSDPLTTDACSIDLLLRGENQISVEVPSWAGSGRYRKEPQNPHRIFVVRVSLLGQLVVVCWHVSSRTWDTRRGRRLMLSNRCVMGSSEWKRAGG